jgi:HEAT repeat protein
LRQIPQTDYPGRRRVPGAAADSFCHRGRSNAQIIPSEDAMTASAWMLSLVLVPGLDDPIGSPRERPVHNETASPSSAEAKALEKLDEPLGEPNVLNLPIKFPLGSILLSRQPPCYYEGSEDQIDALIRTKAAVNQVLIHQAQTTLSLRVRYRAAYILIQRRCGLVARILDSMCESSNEEERYLAWHAYQLALSEKKLKPPKRFERPLQLYAREKDHEVRREIVCFLGKARAKDAVPALIDRLEKKEDPWDVIWALGEIGDPKAVPAIINAFEGDINQHCHLAALGKLATSEAVDFIIDHLDTYGAVKALCRTKSDKALPVLKKHLDHLQQAKGKEKDSDIRDTRIAIIRLSTDDPREPLLKVVEDVQEDASMRYWTLRALQEYDTTPLESRILKLYKESDNTDIKRCCIGLLENGTADGITEAMLDHVLKCDRGDDGDCGTTKIDLRAALHKRLNKAFRKFEDLRAYAEELRKLKDKNSRPGP